MKATKIIQGTPEVSFHRFENALKHIVTVPNRRLLELEKANGHIRSNGKNSHKT